MNPFKVTREEYEQNFGEKKNFLKSLIFLIFKGNEAPSKIEDMLVNQTIVEYYEAYFLTLTPILRMRCYCSDCQGGRIF